ncbi:MAG: peptidyl-prolyl cis-trans isomerase [Acidobacteriota bacterium]
MSPHRRHLGVPWDRAAAGLVVSFACAVVWVSCSPERPVRQEQPAADAGSPAVAIADGQPITVADIDRFVGRTGTESPGGGDLRARYVDLARRVALERLVLDRAHAEGLKDRPEIAATRRELLRTAYSEHLLATRSTPEPITDKALSEHFEATKQRFERPERRRVAHIYLRYDPEDDPKAVRERLEAIRTTILDGQPFEQVAVDVSESESRHHGGSLGFVERGVFPPDFDRIVFALEAHVPSEVVSTDDGVHLFMVTNILEARRPELAALRPLVLRDLHLLRRLDELRAHVAELPDRPRTTRVDDATALRFLDHGPSDLTVLEVGEFTLTVGRFREQFAELGRALGDLADVEQAVRWLDEVEAREILYQHMLSQEHAGESFEVPLDGVEAAVDQALVDLQARHMMRERLASETARLDRYYADNARRFVTPLTLDFERLTLPSAVVDPSVMARLERERDALNQRSTRLADLAAELGGQVRATGPLPLDALRVSDPAAVPLVTRLEVGEHSPPYRSAGDVAMMRLIDRQAPEPLPFDAVRDHVIDEILARDTAALFRELSEDLLAEADFELHDAVLDRLASP